MPPRPGNARAEKVWCPGERLELPRPFRPQVPETCAVYQFRHLGIAASRVLKAPCGRLSTRENETTFPPRVGVTRAGPAGRPRRGEAGDRSPSIETSTGRRPSPIHGRLAAPPVITAPARGTGGGTDDNGSSTGSGPMVYRAPDFKTVAIFGGTGFIGRYIVRDLAKRSWRVNVATRDAERGRATCSRWGRFGNFCPVPRPMFGRALDSLRPYARRRLSVNQPGSVSFNEDPGAQKFRIGPPRPGAGRIRQGGGRRPGTGGMNFTLCDRRRF